MTYTPEQIRIGKRLLSWIESKGTETSLARKEVAKLLKTYPEKKLWSAMQKVGVVSLNALKKTLLNQNLYKSEKILNRRTPLTVYATSEEA